MKPSQLAWTAADYEAAGLETPTELVSNPEMTEGDLMTAEDVAAFIKDSIATLRILADKASPRYDELVAAYKADLLYLAEIGQIEEDDYNELTHPDNLRFHTL